MVDVFLFRNFLLALALGILIGLEREYARYHKRAHDYAGIRTFPLIALFGALAAYLADQLTIWILVVSTLLVGLLIISAYFAVARNVRKSMGATSEMAGFLTFFIGILAYYNEVALASSLAVIMTIILYARSMLHNFAKKIKKRELSDTLKFAVVAIVILPFLPNQSYGPYQFFNPFMFWLMVVFVLGISFVGYILMKWFAEKGIPYIGLLGGLASSTATTTSLAAQAHKEKKMYRIFVLGIILANGIMFLRILFVTFIINRSLFWQLLLPLTILTGTTIGFSYFLWRTMKKKTKGQLHLTSPFTLIPALKFAAFFVLVLAFVKVAHVYFSSAGIYVISFLAGFADVDAITISLSQLVQQGFSLESARNGIIIATLTNMAVKSGLAFWFGGKKIGLWVLSFFAILIGSGILLILWV